MVGTVIVTGGATGIGYAISERLLEGGYEVIICSRNHENLNMAKSHLHSKFDTECGVYSCPIDISDRTIVATTFQRMFSSHDNIIGLVNNASILKPAPFLKDKDFWLKTIETNLIGTYSTSYEFIKNSKSLKGKKIVNIASTLGHVGRAYYSAYCSSKHGVIGLTRALSLEYFDEGLIVNSISPGWVETGMSMNDLAMQAKSRKMDIPAFRKEVERSIPLKRFVKPREVSQLVMYLIQNHSQAISGQDFSINGGELLT